MANPRFIATLQALRAFAAVLVVLNHALVTAADRSGVPVAGHPWLGRLGVELFFAISGVVMVHVTDPLRAGGTSPRDAARFLWGRVVRVVPLYWACTGLVLAAGMLGARRTDDADITPGRVLASLFFIPSTAPDGLVQPVLYVGWTLQFEMAFYLLVALALALRIDPVRLCVPLLAGAGVLSVLRPSDHGAAWFFADPAALSFAVGMLTARLLCDGGRRRAGAVLTAIVAAHVVVSVGHLAGPDPTGAVIAVVVSLVVLPATLADDRVRRWVPPWAVEAGAASYALYLVHPFISTAVGDVLAKAGGTALHPWLFVAALVVAPVVAAPVVHRLVERPVTARLRSWRPPRALFPSSDRGAG